MFLEIDVVEFTDKDIPYTSIMLNMSNVVQFQQIAQRHRDAYTAGRNAVIERQLIDPLVRVSPIEDLPNKGAIMSMAGGVVLYTVTPYTEIRDEIKRLQERQRDGN